MRKISGFALLMLLMLSMSVQSSFAQRITNEKLVKWWLDARFGMMIHWGAYAQAGGYWKGVFEGGYSEWLKFRQIPNVEYDSLIREFNPVDFNADQWMKIASEAGMKYIVFTAKHHDGFAMYDSQITDYDIVDMTKFGRDPLAELATACQKYGVKLGIYYSVDRDWHHPDATCDDHYKQCNFWDYPENKSGAMERWHNSYFPNFAVKQVEELVTRYPIDLVWFDGIGLKTAAEIALLDSIIHTARPNCLINSRINTFLENSDGDYGSKGDNETPGGYQAGGWENPGTLGFSYGYSAKDSFMSPKQAVHNLIEMVSKGGNYLLNVGPDGKGIIIREARDILGVMGDWLNIYGSAIYGADGLPIDPPENVRMTVKPHQLYVHVLNWNDQVLKINGIDKVSGLNTERISQVYMLSDNLKRPLKYQLDQGVLSVDLSSCPIPRSKLNQMAEVIVVTDEPRSTAVAPVYRNWKYSGSMYILTTPDGADLHVSASVKDFPVLVRLDKSNFNFSQAKRLGEDVRFSSGSGEPLFYQIEEWNSEQETASIWVRIPEIKGNEQQELKMYWGRPKAESESNGKAVFGESNGFVSVLHMNDSLVDEVGSLDPVNVGTSATAGIVGSARNLKEGQGISGGDSVPSLPQGTGPFTTEAWFRSSVSEGIIVGWGNEERTGKAIMQLASPPKVRVDGYWSGANVSSISRIDLSQWIHVVHTCQHGDSRLYINGKLDGVSNSIKNPLNIKSPVGFYFGGWRNDYWFDGDIDEVRISKTVRSAEWIRLQYENQKPMQTLLGPLVSTGNGFSVSVEKIDIEEDSSVLVDGYSGNARKTYWLINKNGQDEVAAVDQRLFRFDAGRVTADKNLVLKFKAVYVDTVRIYEVPVKISESIPEPVFNLVGPAQWNGRDQITIVPEISNMDAMQTSGAGTLNFKWTVTGGAVIKEVVPGKLILKRSQFSGSLTVSLAMNNGGADFVARKSIQVTEPVRDPWITTTPGIDEKPVDNQFIARNDQNVGVLHYNGKLESPGDSVYVRVYADDKLFNYQKQKTGIGQTYAFTIHLKPGLIKYRIEFGPINLGREKAHDIVTNIVCGDAYIIDGQSNAEANDYGRAVNPYTSDFLRSFGCADTDPEKCRLKLWGNAASFDNQGAKLQIGYWGIELGKQLIENQKMPVCFINGSVGGSRIDVHQRNESNLTDSTTIYGRLLWRIQQAGLTHGIRGVFWHQGENDQGAAGPGGRFGWEDYQQYFIDMAAAWKEDYPNIQHYYVFQIWPRSCAMTENGSDNMLREVQRTLPNLFSNMSIMSTLGIRPPGGCHFPPEGYAEIARLIGPLVERDHYGKKFPNPITPPNLNSAYFSDDLHSKIILRFDQPVIWNDNLRSQFYLDGKAGLVKSGYVSGNEIHLQLNEPVNAQKINYLDSKSWTQENILWGENGIAALTFWEVPIARK
jgi:hypothetical protein